MSNLFEDNAQDHKILDMADATITYYGNFLASGVAESYFNELLTETPWQQDDIKVFNKIYAQPRLTALYAVNDKTYTYSGITMQPHPFTPLLLKIKKKVETLSGLEFTTCLLNLYRQGKDSNGWHADDEKELGVNPAIASISLGHPRMFKFRRKDDKKNVLKLLLTSGSLLLMEGSTQHFWQHQLPKTSRKIGPRINLTFRHIL